MPSGSADLRQLWLSLEAKIGEQVVRIPADSQSRGFRTFDVVGRGEWDQEILGEDIPKGSRIYRAVFLDETGKQTLSSYKAVKIAFDNRLEASEIRKETFQFIVPPDARGSMVLRAALYYLPYPSSFADRLGVRNPEPVEVASAEAEIPLQ